MAKRPRLVPSPDSVVSLGDLTPDPENARLHNPRNIEMIADSLNEVGAARSIVIDENNVVLAGNGVIEGAAQAGIESVRIIEASGHEIIAVRRSGLTADQKKRLALFDNRAGDLSTWDPALLATLPTELTRGLWTRDEMLKIQGLAPEHPGNFGDPKADGVMRYLVVIECENEDQQTTQLQRLMAEGLTCRAMYS